MSHVSEVNLDDARGRMERTHDRSIRRVWLEDEAGSVEGDQLVDPTDMFSRLRRELAVLAMIPSVSLILALGMLGRALHWSHGNIWRQLTPQLGRSLWLPDVIVLCYGRMLLGQSRRFVSNIALSRVFVAGPHCPSPLIRINLFNVLPRYLRMVLSCCNTRLSWDLDPMGGGLRDLLWLFDLRGILGT